MLHLFKHSFPEDMETGLEEIKVFDHPYTTMPSADRKDLASSTRSWATPATSQ